MNRRIFIVRILPSLSRAKNWSGIAYHGDNAWGLPRSMNTPAHALLNLVVLGSGSGRVYTRPIFWGSVAPDVPMLFFYLWQRIAMGAPEAVIWGERYFEQHWQDFFDVFNSIPLAVLGVGVCFVGKRMGGATFFASMLLHHALDLPLHREDAHRHFLPLSDFRFESPVSYWDPARFGAWAALAEAALVAGCVALLWPRFPKTRVRVILVGLAVLQAVAWVALYGFGWLPSPP